jgi:hypothetical protein
MVTVEKMANILMAKPRSVLAPEYQTTVCYRIMLTIASILQCLEIVSPMGTQVFCMYFIPL